MRWLANQGFWSQLLGGLAVAAIVALLTYLSTHILKAPIIIESSYSQTLIHQKLCSELMPGKTFILDDSSSSKSCYIARLDIRNPTDAFIDLGDLILEVPNSSIFTRENNYVVNVISATSLRLITRATSEDIKPNTIKFVTEKLGPEDSMTLTWFVESNKSADPSPKMRTSNDNLEIWSVDRFDNRYWSDNEDYRYLYYLSNIGYVLTVIFLAASVLLFSLTHRANSRNALDE